MSYPAQLEQLHRLLDPIVHSPDPPTSAFQVPGHSEAGDGFSAAYDAILLNPQHQHHAITASILSIGDFTRLGILGEGQFGKVHAVRCSLNGATYAMKSIDKYKACRVGNNLSLAAERLIHLLAEGCDSAPAIFTAFQTSTTLYLVTDLAPFGSLADRLDASGALSESEVYWWSGQLLQAVEWVHDQGFAHRDIKPANIVISDRGRALLTDFGSAAVLQAGNRLSEGDCVVPVGTPDYIAPEVLQCAELALMQQWEDSTARSPVYTAAVDFWSLGVTIFELAVGRTPFYAPDIHATYAAILATAPLIQEKMSVELRLLVQGLLSPVGDRFGAMEVRQHVRGDKGKGTRPSIIDERIHDEESSFAHSTLSLSLESAEPSITQIGPRLGAVLTQWYGWSRLPTIASVTSGMEHNRIAPPKTPTPYTPRKANANQTDPSIHRRRELLQCVQESARKHVRQGKQSVDVAQALEDLVENLDGLARRLESMKARIEP